LVTTVPALSWCMTASGHPRTGHPVLFGIQCPLRPTNDRTGMAAQNLAKGQSQKSISSSARTSSDGGTVNPSALAVLRWIDSEVVLCRCLHRQTGSLLALEDTVHISRGADVWFDCIGSIRDYLVVVPHLDPKALKGVPGTWNIFRVEQ
jgi:hypothetical protein